MAVGPAIALGARSIGKSDAHGHWSSARRKWNLTTVRGVQRRPRHRGPDYSILSKLNQRRRHDGRPGSGGEPAIFSSRERFALEAGLVPICAHRRWLWGRAPRLSFCFQSSSAWAHASFVGGAGGYPVNTDHMLTLNVPHECDSATYNVDVVIAIPAGWGALSCQTTATWTCSLGTVDSRPVVRFTKNEGAEPAEDKAFRFTARTARTGERFGFPTVQTYNTGDIVRWIGAAGAEKPTPMLATLPTRSAPQTTPSTTNSDASPTTSATVRHHLPRVRQPRHRRPQQCRLLFRPRRRSPQLQPTPTPMTVPASLPGSWRR